MSAPEPAPIDTALIEKWALSYLEHYASSAAHLRLVLRRWAARRSGGDRAAVAAAGQLIEALIERYRAAGLLDDAAYAVGRAQRRLARGESLRRIAAGLAARGVGAEDVAAALNGLKGGTADPELAAACAFARRRRIGPFRRGAADAIERRHELAAFARGGFARRIAEGVLACPDEAAVAALLADAAR